jgi:tRNA threonylcarbamoyladenosine biosynthesis protein TsaB
VQNLASLRILALETSGTAASVAALAGDKLLAEWSLEPPRRSAQALAPAIADVLRLAGWKPGDVQLVAVTIGPGSFTGLRIGVTTAKMLAYAVGAEIIGVNTLEVIASQTSIDVPRVSVAIDAQRGQVYAAQFARGDVGGLVRVKETAIVDGDLWLAGLNEGMTASGPALATLAARLPRGIHAASEDFWMPTARSTGKVALAHFAAGRRDDVFQLLPLYLRTSAAEEKWEAKGGTP